jgi:NAD(P)-dependent dehydrogenase (short-subunit alcohol dehydrogenase family)
LTKVPRVFILRWAQGERRIIHSDGPVRDRWHCHRYNFSEENLKGRFGRIFNDVLYAFHPLLKNLGTPADVDRMAVCLASEDADWMTGSIQVVDGGYTAG